MSKKRDVRDPLSRLAPGNVELYADGAQGNAAVRHAMTRVGPLVGAVNGYLYRASVPASRPVADFTARVIPSGPGVLVPLEAARLLWQR